MALAETTGHPPAVTHEQVEAWITLANHVTAAFQMGGEQGMTLLTNIMAEWCEAVDDVNSARQIVVDLADRGLRHEAIEWHADGFFDAADQLDPTSRPGWKAWKAVLEERGVVTPQIDRDLKEASNRIHEDLELRDLVGQPLADYLSQLRRNVLVRGHLGERMLLLESIRGLDPAGTAWKEMMSPIRRQRAGAVEDEARLAIANRDFEALGRLRAEMTAAEGWQDDVPGTLAALLDAASHWDAVGETRRKLSAAAVTLVRQCEDGRRQIPGSSAEVAAVQAANATRHEFQTLCQSLTAAAESVRAVPEFSDLIRESGLTAAVKELEAAVADAGAWLDRMAVESQRRAEAAKFDATIHAHLKSVPAVEGSLERCKPLVKRWRQRAIEIERRVRRKTSHVAGGPLPSTIDLLEQLEMHSKALQEALNKKKWREKFLVAVVVGGVAAVVLGLLLFIIVASAIGN